MCLDMKSMPCLLLGLSLMLMCASADIFSSTSHLQNLMYLERHLILKMSDYVVDLETQLNSVKSYLSEFSNSAGRPELFQSDDDGDAIVGNPLQAYHLIKRLTVNWNTVKKAFSGTNFADLEGLTKEYSMVMPREEDLHGAAMSIIRLQDTYNVNISQFAAGIIEGTAAKVDMNARDCLYIGKHSFNNGYYGQSMQWFQESLVKAQEERNTTASVEEIMPFYDMAAKIYDDLLPEYTVNITNKPMPPKLMRLIDGDDPDYRRYQALCRGEVLRTTAETSQLKCHYTTNNNHPWLVLQPVAVEQFKLSPLVVQFHGLLTDKESELIKEMAAPMLQRAKVQTDTNKRDEVSGTRTSQTAWFSTDEHEIADRLARRIEAVTGLSNNMNESHCELMQVANYGMGGHYSPHYDYLIADIPEDERHLLPELELFAGDRVATLMFYLSNVQLGGATVFPRLGVRLTPQMGSAAFWYNLYRNGTGIEDTVHGACPVLMGEKWVSNHWIRERGQMIRRPCTLDPIE
ncbi:Prolyl 4-hydroxylase subunit alpha-2 [Halotydeus destructor]|nr:Prolyl 4-hydroxylase subunit alpha-2 [Halotydeus destructor]